MNLLLCDVTCNGFSINNVLTLCSSSLNCIRGTNNGIHGSESALLTALLKVISFVLKYWKMGEI